MNAAPDHHPIELDRNTLLKRTRATELVELDELQQAFRAKAARGGPFTADAISRLLKRIGERAGLPATHAHMLRHGCGYALANAGTIRARSRTCSATARSSKPCVRRAFADTFPRFLARLREQTNVVCLISGA